MRKKNNDKPNILKIIGIIFILLFPIFFNLTNIRTKEDLPSYGSAETKNIFEVGFPVKYYQVSYKDCHFPFILNPDGSRYISEDFECGSTPHFNMFKFTLNILFGIIEGALLVLFYLKVNLNLKIKVLSTILIFTILELLAILI
jgi:hypothetical protein